MNFLRALSYEKISGAGSLDYAFVGSIWFNNFAYNGYHDIYRMRPLSSSTVFNFFTPDFKPAGALRDRGINAPEFQIIDDTSLVVGQAHLRASIYNGPGLDKSPWRSPALDVSREIAILTGEGAGALVDHLDMLFAPGQLTPATRSAIITALDETDGGDADERTRMAIYLLFFSPDYSIAR